jgi:Tfp pilus assembly protein PilF
VEHQAQQTRARIRLNVCYGYLKLHNWNNAAHWLIAALRANPRVLFERRWFALAFARLKNQWQRRMRGIS